MAKVPEIDDDVLEEGCYYLTQAGLTPEQVGGSFGIAPSRVAELSASYASKLKSGRLAPSDIDKTFWEDVRKEAEGDVKVTFVSGKGFHHAWKSELAALDGNALMSIFESSKDFLGADPNVKFLDFPPPKGYDPLALDREVRKAVELISKILEQKWKEQKSRGVDAHA